MFSKSRRIDNIITAARVLLFEFGKYYESKQMKISTQERKIKERGTHINVGKAQIKFTKNRDLTSYTRIKQQILSHEIILLDDMKRKKELTYKLNKKLNDKYIPRLSDMVKEYYQQRSADSSRNRNTLNSSREEMLSSVQHIKLMLNCLSDIMYLPDYSTDTLNKCIDDKLSKIFV